jgi:hypothetical protein
MLYFHNSFIFKGINLNQKLFIAEQLKIKLFLILVKGLWFRKRIRVTSQGGIEIRVTLGPYSGLEIRLE